MNLKVVLEQAARQYAKNTAIALGEQRLTYAELDRAANKIANALLGMRVRKGDRVTMLMGNTPEFAVAYFGIAKAGATANPLDTRYTLSEMTNVLNNCRPRVIIGESPMIDRLAPAISQLDFIEQVITLNPVAGHEFTSYQQIMASSSAESPNVTISPDDIATISYSGGPTNRPTGAELPHRAIVGQSTAAGDAFEQTSKDVVMLFALPMYHMFGMSAVLLTAVSRGSSIIIVPGTGVSIESLMATIEREKGTILFGVPYIYALAVKVAKREGVKSDLSSLRLCGSGGAPILVSTIQQFKQYYGLTIIDIYGLTEAVCHVCCPPLDGTGKLGSAGKVLPGFEIKIMDDNDREVPTNHNGEVVIRGNIMKGYHNNPPDTARALKNGWLHTGDIGRIDKDGYLFITGRKKRMLILKGQNVYPDDVEEVLATHPRIAETRVIGVADRLRGEIVRAFIRIKAGETADEAEIRHFCQERMADYKVPRQIIFTEELPEGATARSGKKPLKEYLPKLPPMPSYNPAKSKRHTSEG